MKEKILLGAIGLLAGSLLAADSSLQDAVKDAAKSLGAKDNYSWKTTIEFGGNEVGTIEGKTEKGGASVLALSRGDTAMDAVLKGGKGRQRGLPRIEKEPRRNQGGEEIAHSGHGENGGEDLY